MRVYDLLELWWVMPVGVALAGYGLSLAGLSRAQRAVWVTARIVEVGLPEHGASRRPGIPVTVAFRDPATGQEFVLPNEGEHGDAVEGGLGGPRGRGCATRAGGRTGSRLRPLITPDEKNGRVVPDGAVALLLLGLAIHATVIEGWTGALLGLGSLLTVLAAISPDIRTARARDALLASAVAVPARVVAVTKDIHTDAEGGEIVNHVPVSHLHHPRGRPRHRPLPRRHPQARPVPRPRPHHPLRAFRPHRLHARPCGRPPCRREGHRHGDHPADRRNGCGGDRGAQAVTPGPRRRALNNRPSRLVRDAHLSRPARPCCPGSRTRRRR